MSVGFSKYFFISFFFSIGEKVVRTEVRDPIITDEIHNIDIPLNCCLVALIHKVSKISAKQKKLEEKKIK